jgi:hypothetical protein
MADSKRVVMEIRGTDKHFLWVVSQNGGGSDVYSLSSKHTAVIDRRPPPAKSSDDPSYKWPGHDLLGGGVGKVTLRVAQSRGWAIVLYRQALILISAINSHYDILLLESVNSFTSSAILADCWASDRISVIPYRKGDTT